jgi:hypothetical protein
MAWIENQIEISPKDFEIKRQDNQLTFHHETSLDSSSTCTVTTFHHHGSL